MAEGIIESLVGGEGGEERLRSSQAAVGPADPVAVAIALNGGLVNPALIAKTQEYFEQQTKLVLRQRELLDHELRHFEAEWRIEARAAGRKRLSESLKIALQMAVGLIGLVVLVGLVQMIVQASQSRSVVVEAFQVPSSLAPQGITGQVIAAGVLDQLQKLQLATRSSEAALETKSAWSSDIKIELPETGVSIGEVDRVLHERLGHDLHVGGDLLVTKDGGLQLTVRGGQIIPATFTGKADELGKLSTQAAEYIYGSSQPVQFSTYLVDTSRWGDVTAFVTGALHRVESDEIRAKLLNNWGTALAWGENKTAEAEQKYRQAIALQPTFWNARANLVITAVARNEEAGYQAAIEFLKAVEAAAPKDKPRMRLITAAAQSAFDNPLFLAANLDDLNSNHGNGTKSEAAANDTALAYAMMHDTAGEARARLQADPMTDETKFYAAANQMTLALYSGRPADAASLLPAAQQEWKLWVANSAFQLGDDTSCMAGYVFALNGNAADSAEAFKREANYNRCYAFRGMLLERQNNLVGAEAVWNEGAAKAPDIPWVHLARGESRMRRGDFAGAAADFAAAHASAPHFADALKDWGDLLVAQGKGKDAIAKYDEALKYAPEWPELKQARGGLH